MTDSMLSAEVRREINRQRFATSLVNDKVKPTAQTLSRMMPELLAGFDTKTMTRTELNSMIADVKRAVITEWSGMWKDIDPELLKMAKLEGIQEADLYNDYAEEYFVAPTSKAIEVTTRTAVMSLTGSTSSSGTWAQYMRKNANYTAGIVDAEIRNGFGNSLTLSEMTQNLRGTYNRKTKKYVGGLLNNTATSRAEALVRTGTSHYASVARDDFALANKDNIISRVYFATLDNRTTTICLGRNGNEYELGETYPELPAHYNCRSVYLFKTPSFDPSDGTRPITSGRKGGEAKEAYEARKARQDKLRNNRAEKRAEGQETPETKSKVTYRGRKDSDTFQVKLVKGEMTGDEFMRSNPRWFVESSLGKKKAAMFLDDGLSLDKFTDLVGRPLTIKELKEAGY